MTQDRGQEHVVLRIMLPGGGWCTVSTDVEFGRRQIRALIRMLEATDAVLAEDEVDDARRAAAPAADGGGDGT